MARVMIVDDEEFFRRRVAAAVEAAGVEVVAQCASGEEAVAVGSAACDLVLLDINMPGMGGIAALRALVESDPEVRVVMLTAFADERWLWQALAAGAKGFVTKTADRAELLVALRAVMSGREYIQGRAVELLTEGYRSADSAVFQEKLAELGESERAVWGKLCEAKSNREIARELQYAESSIKELVSKVLVKMGVRSRAEVILQAANNGML